MIELQVDEVEDTGQMINDILTLIARTDCTYYSVSHVLCTHELYVLYGRTPTDTSESVITSPSFI